MTNKQMRAMFDNEPPPDVHPMAQLFLHPLGMKFTPEMMNDLASFIFDMCGAKLPDVEPTTVDYRRGWKDSRDVDEYVPGAEFTAAWSPILPPGISLNPRTGHMVGTLPSGLWEWTVHLSPQVKYDNLGGSGTPNEDGRWIGFLEDREPVADAEVDVSSMTPEQKAKLRAALDEED